MMWFARTMINCFHKGRYRVNFGLSILVLFCFSLFHMDTSHYQDNDPPPQRILAYVCMNKFCNQSFTNLYAYDQHRTHARNANSLCANITMRREIIATRRAGVTTSVVKEIASKREQRSRGWSVNSYVNFWKIRWNGKVIPHFQKISKNQKLLEAFRDSKAPDMGIYTHIRCFVFLE